MMRHAAIALGLAALVMTGPSPLALAATAPIAPPAAVEPPDMAALATEALSWGDFDQLEGLLQEATRSARPNADGLSQTTSFMAGLHRLWNIGEPDATDAYFANLDELTAEWLKTHPHSSLAAALRIRALHARAWFYRGGGYANTLSEPQVALFRRYIQQAVDVAREADIGADDVMSHIFLVMVARSADIDWATQRAFSEQTLARHPDAFGIWQELLYSAEPKWGGDWSLVSRMVTDAATRQKTPEEGDMMYARLWDTAWYELEGEFFEAPVDWIRVKRGFRAIVTRYPATGLVNAFARLACLRRDRAAAQDMMDRVNEQPDFDYWGYGTRGRSAFDQCRRWLRDPDAPPAPDAAPAPRAKGAGTQS
jgi:hypothetical protein